MYFFHLMYDKKLLRKLEKAITRSGKTELISQLFHYMNLSMYRGLYEKEIEEIEELISLL